MTEGFTESKGVRRGKRIDAICWGLFFIWMGTIMIIKSFPDGIGSFGIGVIVLGGAIARLILGATVSAFWIIIGTLFVLAGVGELYAIDLPLLPIALIVSGVLLLFHGRTKRPKPPS